MTDRFDTVGRTTYVYADNYRLAALTRKVGSNEELTVKNGYDDAGRLTSRARTVSTASKANITTTFQYDNANRLGTITHAKQRAAGRSWGRSRIDTTRAGGSRRIPTPSTG
jgi:YD repeat-containing protein